MEEFLIPTAPVIKQQRAALLSQAINGRLRFCSIVWLAQRVLLQGIGVVANLVAGPAPHAVGPGFFGHFANWDSGWFSCITRLGYFGPACGNGATVERFAFFPLYPTTARGVAWVVGEGEVTTGPVLFGLWLVAAVGSYGAVVMLFLLAERMHGIAVARRTAILFLFSPYAIFLVTSYSEALYLATAIGAWYACYRRHYVLCAGLGVLATLSRASGLFLVPALIVLYLSTTRRDNRPVRFHELGLVTSSALGVLGYWTWLWSRTGDPMAWSHAQEQGWNRTTRWPWETLLNQGIHVLREPKWDWQVQAVFEVVFAMGIGLAVLLLIRKRNWPALTLVALTAASLMTSNSYLSLARNTLTLFPLFILVAGLAHTRRRLVGCLVVSVALLIFNTLQFATGHWAD